MPPLLPEAAEIEAALSAAPSHLRGDAGVYVLTESGYRQVRESGNGFTCLINRAFADAFEPECFDAEGTATILPVVLFHAQQRARGGTRQQIERDIEARYARGEFIAPRRVGICYMLSNRNVVVLDRKTGKVGPAGPHLMFYAPNLHNQQFGATPDFASHFLIADEGSATAMIIVPVNPTASDVAAHH